VIPKDVTMKELNESIEEEGKGSIHHYHFIFFLQFILRLLRLLRLIVCQWNYDAVTRFIFLKPINQKW